MVNYINSCYRVLTHISDDFTCPTAARTCSLHSGKLDTPCASMSASCIFLECILSFNHVRYAKTSPHSIPKSSSAFSYLLIMASRNNPTWKELGILME